MENKFFGLLQFAIGESKSFQLNVSDEEWESFFETSKKQSLQGVLFQAIMKLPVEQQPPRSLKLKWITRVNKISMLSQNANKVAVKLSDGFLRKGVKNCILKGQGNAVMYPWPEMRVCGDIDIWLHESPTKIVRKVKKRRPSAKACYHHIDFCSVDGIPIEIHYRPSFMNNLICNFRLQKWFSEKSDEQCSNYVELADGVGKIPVPTDGFNRIFQMAHISNHVMHEGIGLRQLLDYYFLLQRGFTVDERQEDERLLRRFGLYKVASAVMYVLKEVFGLADDKMIVAPDDKRGRFLLDEILLSGNFGKYDERLKNSKSQTSKNVQRLKRDLRFMRYFPSECLWEPVFRWYHFFWRLRYN